MEHGLIAWLIIGAVAGWLAGVLVKGGGFGLLADILIGIVGAVIGGWLAGLLEVLPGSQFWLLHAALVGGAGVGMLLVKLLFGRLLAPDDEAPAAQAA